jgi:hypothetical protein
MNCRPRRREFPEKLGPSGDFGLYVYSAIARNEALNRVGHFAPAHRTGRLSMLRLRRGWVAVSLSAYVLAAMAVHFLHDHGAQHACCPAESTAADSTSAPHHDGDCPGGPCEDSCFACRYLAIQSIAPAIVAPAALITVVEPVPEPETKLVSADRPALQLTRGPPCA